MSEVTDDGFAPAGYLEDAGQGSAAYAISDEGHVVGARWESAPKAALWIVAGGQVEGRSELGVLEGCDASVAFAVNRSGTVVGACYARDVTP